MSDNLYTREVIVVWASLKLEIMASKKIEIVDWHSTYGIKTKSPKEDKYLWHVVKAAKQNSCQNAASFVIYNLALNHINTNFSSRPVPDSSLKFEKMRIPLTYYADECTFQQTGDYYLWLVTRMHLPSCVTMFTTENPFEEMAKLLQEDANDLIRPYIDTLLSEQISKRDLNSDSVVLFVILATVIAEAETEKKLKIKYNRDLVNTSDVPTPFVVCDFPLNCLNGSDAYGFVQNNTLFVGNGKGVAATMAAWIDACGSRFLKNTHNALHDNFSETNVFMKYVS